MRSVTCTVWGTCVVAERTCATNVVSYHLYKSHHPPLHGWHGIRVIEVIVAASNERGVTNTVVWVIKLLHLVAHPPCINFIIVWTLFEGGINFALAVLVHVVQGLFEGRKKSRKYSILRLNPGITGQPHSQNNTVKKYTNTKLFKKLIFANSSRLQVCKVELTIWSLTTYVCVMSGCKMRSHLAHSVCHHKTASLGIWSSLLF